MLNLQFNMTSGVTERFQFDGIKYKTLRGDVVAGINKFLPSYSIDFKVLLTDSDYKADPVAQLFTYQDLALRIHPLNFGRGLQTDGRYFNKKLNLLTTAQPGQVFTQNDLPVLRGYISNLSAINLTSTVKELSITFSTDVYDEAGISADEFETENQNIGKFFTGENVNFNNIGGPFYSFDFKHDYTEPLATTFQSKAIVKSLGGFTLIDDYFDFQLRDNRFYTVNATLVGDQIARFRRFFIFHKQFARAFEFNGELVSFEDDELEISYLSTNVAQCNFNIRRIEEYRPLTLGI